MRRRTYLARTSLIGAIAVAPGCTEEALEDAEKQSPLFEGLYEESEVDLPVQQEFDVLEARVKLAADGSFASTAEFEGHLEDAGVGPERLGIVESEGETVAELALAPELTADAGNADVVGIVAGGFAAFVRGGFSGDGLDASVHDADGRKFGAFDIETGWADAYVSGSLSAAEYGGDVLRTLETKRSTTADRASGR